jgi:hypothetical protein
VLINKSLEDVDLQSLKTLQLPEVWVEVLPFYSIDKKLGAGTYGTVVSAKCK